MDTCSVKLVDGNLCSNAAIDRVNLTARGMVLRAPICQEHKKLLGERKAQSAPPGGLLGQILRGGPFGL